MEDLHELSHHLLGGQDDVDDGERLDPKEAKWSRMMAEMRAVGAALASAIEELAA